MRHLMSPTCVLILVFAAAPSTWADAPTAVDHLVAAAQIVRVDAEAVQDALTDVDANLMVVQQRVQVLNARTAALMQVMVGPVVASASLSPTQAQALERARTAAGIMLALITDKAAVLADTASAADASTASARRELLRDKADGLARSAASIERDIARARG